MAVEFESLAKLAQNYVAACPVIVLGAGASIPYGLPSMDMLARELLKRVVVHGEGPDTTLWQSFRHKLEETKDLEESLHQVTLSGPLLSEVIRHTWEYISECDVKVHDAVLCDPTRLSLTRLFRYLLRRANPRACVITTNYDRLAEYAASPAGAAFCTGFAPGYFGRFNVRDDDIVYFTGRQGHVHVWKVHGSLDWFVGPDGGVVSVQGTRQTPQGFQPLMVTPGMTKYRQVHQDPFRTVMTQADAALKKASGFLCIGYGFNDEHIQPQLLARHRKDDIPVVVATKSLSAKGRNLLLEKPGRRFLILEERAGGTRVYLPEYPGGVMLDGRDVWSLARFTDMVVGERE